MLQAGNYNAHGQIGASTLFWPTLRIGQQMAYRNKTILLVVPSIQTPYATRKSVKMACSSRSSFRQCHVCAHIQLQCCMFVKVGSDKQAGWKA